MFGDMRLHEQGCQLRVDTRGKKPHCHVAGPLGQCVLVVLAGDGVQVDDADERLVATLQDDPILNRSEPVANVQLARRLNPRKYAWHVGNLPSRNRAHKNLSPLDLLHQARAAAAAAGDYLRQVRRPADPREWSLKGSRDFVTEVDRNAEEIVSELLLAADPAARIVGEELAPELVSDGLVWIVDPLDGTTNFLHGFPSYAVSIAAVVDGIHQAGVVLHVPRNEFYCASRGGGAWLGDQRLSVSTIDDPEFALIGTGFPFRDLSRLAQYQSQFARVAGATSGIRRPGSAALDLADVAAGRFDGFWEQRLSAWDVAAGTLLIREAGGIVTNDEGRDIGIEHTPVVAGNPSIHEWLIRTLNVDLPA